MVDDELRQRVLVAGSLLNRITSTVPKLENIPEWRQFLIRDQSLARQSLNGAATEDDYELWLMAVKELADVTIW
jgi:hypothetical protein